MENKNDCSTAWTELITVISQGEGNIETLIPYGSEICETLNNRQLGIRILSYKDATKALKELTSKINNQRLEIEKEKKRVDEWKNS